MDWLERLAADLGTRAPSKEETDELLSVAREVAHRVERRITPLAAFVIGEAVGARQASGEPRDRALEAALRIVESALPTAVAEPEEDPSGPTR